MSASLHGDWQQLRARLRARWSRLSDEDVSAVAGVRQELVRRLKARYGKSFSEIEREVTEFELQDIWAANMARKSLGITSD